MFLSGFDLALWAAGFIGHTILLTLLFRKNRYKEFPPFTALICFNLVRSAILFLIRAKFGSHAYFRAYWSLAGVDEALGFAIVYGIASIVFRPAGTWARDVKTALWATVAVSIVFAGLLTAMATPSTLVPVQAVILKGKFLSSTLITELFVGMMVLSSRVGLPWRASITRICQGLGIYAAFCVIADTTLTWYGVHDGSELYSVASHARMLVYLLCQTYWIVALAQKSPEREPLPEGLRNQLILLQEQLDSDLVRLQAWK